MSDFGQSTKDDEEEVKAQKNSKNPPTASQEGVMMRQTQKEMTQTRK